MGLMKVFFHQQGLPKIKENPISGLKFTGFSKLMNLSI